MKISFRRIAHAITGFSTPVFGVSWNPPRSEIEIVENLLAFLEDRRVLYNPLQAETPRDVIRSIQQIRQRLTEDIQKVDGDSHLARVLRAMRLACRKFVDDTDELAFLHTFEAPLYHIHGTGEMRVMVALMELRSVFGLCITQLSTRYGVDIEASLASILPSVQTAELIESSTTDEEDFHADDTAMKRRTRRSWASSDDDS